MGKVDLKKESSLRIIHQVPQSITISECDKLSKTVQQLHNIKYQQMSGIRSDRSIQNTATTAQIIHHVVVC